MKTTYVGTRGYQAPELLLDKEYDLSCDVFSIGVVLFILLTGYPPFEQATAKDRWYKSMTKKNYKVFWKAHRASPLANNKAAKDLLERMLAYNPKERISIADIKKHEWFNGKYLEGKELISALRHRHREMEQKRKKDSRKQEDLQSSLKKKRDINFGGIVVPQFLPSDIDESIGLLHTTTDWQEIYNVIDGVVGQVGGTAIYDQETMTLTCKMNVAASQEKLEDVQVFEFELQVFLSYLYNDDKVFKAMEEHRQESLKNQEKTFGDKNKNDDAKEDDAEKAEKLRQEQMRARLSVKPCYAVRIVRKSGDELTFQNKIRRNFLMLKCGTLFSGIPKDRLPKDEFYAEDEESNDDDDDVDYDTFLKDEGFKMDPMKQIALDDAKVDA